MSDTGLARPGFELRKGGAAGEGCVLVLRGDWRLPEPWPGLAPVREALDAVPRPGWLGFELAGLGGWGSALVGFLLRVREECAARGVRFEGGQLPGGLRRLMDLATAVPAASGVGDGGADVHPVEWVGLQVLAWRQAAHEWVGFLGECTLSVGAWMRGRAFFRRADLGLLMQQCGADALPIVSLIAALVGLILAFVGAVQLERFGAALYVADLVAIAMTREMGCMMVAIVMCGRTGAAFAAQLGTMKVNQELDAFRMFGVSMVDFLVMPRLVALVLMMPLLTIYADLVGILGGFVVGRLMLDLSLTEYWNETMSALTLLHVGSGVLKSLVFGAIVGFAGCWRGLRCGTNAAAVGVATTSAVVTGITGVIAADAIFAVVFNLLGI